MHINEMVQDNKRTKRAAAIQAAAGFQVPGTDEVWRGAELWQATGEARHRSRLGRPNQQHKPTAARRKAAAAATGQQQRWRQRGAGDATRCAGGAAQVDAVNPQPEHGCDQIMRRHGTSSSAGQRRWPTQRARQRRAFICSGTATQTWRSTCATSCR